MLHGKKNAKILTFFRAIKNCQSEMTSFLTHIFVTLLHEFFAQYCPIAGNIAKTVLYCTYTTTCTNEMLSFLVLNRTVSLLFYTYNILGTFGNVWRRKAHVTFVDGIGYRDTSASKGL